MNIVRLSIVGMTSMTCAMTAPAAIAGASIVYSAYEGPPQVATGTGGTKIAKGGIDYWTSGSPPRRYQVIGMVQDKRDETWDGGHAIGSPTVTGKVKKAGGDAVIVEDQQEAGNSGSSGSANRFFGLFMGGGSKTMTRMLVIRYLPEATSQPGS